jgi:hypothetical protein
MVSDGPGLAPGLASGGDHAHSFAEGARAVGPLR